MDSCTTGSILLVRISSKFNIPDNHAREADDRPSRGVLVLLLSLLSDTDLTVLDPTQKAGYFKKHWSEQLQKDVLAEAEEIVGCYIVLVTFLTLFSPRNATLSSLAKGKPPDRQSKSLQV